MNLPKLLYVYFVFNFASSAYAQYPNEDIIKYHEYIKDAKQLRYSNISAAIEYAESARLIAHNINDSSLVFNAYLVIGSLYGLKGKYDSALEFYVEAESFLDLSNARNVAEYHMHMGSMYWSLKENRKAMSYTSEALDAYCLMHDTLNIAVMLNLKGLIEIEQKNYTEASILLDSAILLNRKINHINGVFFNLNNLALIPGEEDHKIGYLKEIIRKNTKDSLFWALAENYNNLTLVYLRKGQLAHAKESLHKAYAMAKKSSSTRLLIDNFKLASDIAINEGDHKNAYYFMLERNQMIEDAFVKDKLEEVEEELEIKRKLKQQALIERQAFMMEQQKKEKRTSVVFVMIIFVLTAIFMILYYRRKLDIYRLEKEMTVKNKKLIEQELQKKKHVIIAQQEQITMHNNELIDLIYYIKSKDKLVDNVQVMIKEVYKIATSEIQNQLKLITVFIKQHRDKEKKINLFTDHLAAIESRFFEKLEQKHPNLTKNEKVLAAYLRIGLSTKEIAFLVDSNPKSVNMARYRLRKSLNLEADESLIEYFATILD
ncbi:MAG: tetratricopeptide repeat protein [Tannerellaceae bacterium]